MTIGDRIAKYRRNQGLSQEELAEKLGISLPVGIQVGAE